MNFLLNKDDLLRAISYFKKIAPPTSTNPILQGTLFEIKDNTLTLTAFNLTIGIKTTILLSSLNTDNEAFVVSTMQLLNCITKMKDDIKFELNNSEKQVVLKSGNVKYTISIMDAEDFPEIPIVNDSAIVQFPSNNFLKGIEKTLYAVNDNEEKNSKLFGVQISTREKYLQFEAVDGFRLAKYNVDLDYQGEPFMITIKKDAINLVSTLLNKENVENITISKSGNHCVFEVGNYQIFSSTLTADHFNLDSFMKKEDEKIKISVNTETLIETVEQATPVIETAEKNPLKITLLENKKILIVSASSIGSSEACCTAESSNLDETMFVIGVNYRYFLDALKHIGSEKIDIFFSTPVSPVRITEHENEDSWSLVLPVRLKK